MNISGLSGLRATQTQLDVTGNNIANALTPGFQQKTVNLQDIASGGVKVSSITPYVPNSTEGLENNVDLATQIVNLKQEELMYSFNAKTIKAQSDTLGKLLDIMA